MESSILRARARERLQGEWALSIAVALMAVLLGGHLTGSSFFPELRTQIPVHSSRMEEWSQWLRWDIRFADLTLSFPSGILSLAAFVVGGTLQLGYAGFLLKQHDGREKEFGDLFSQFDRFGTGFAQKFLRELYTGLWALLFLIPGIVKSISYSMTPFILAENPELTASQAIEASQELMDGHKMDLFLLDLSFLGWDLLAALTLNLGYLLLNPYRNAAHAAFYRQLVCQRRYIPDT